MNSAIKIGSNRSFGIVFFLIFLTISLYPLLHNNTLRLIPLIISILEIKKSKLLTPLNILWFKFGLFLGKFFSPIILSLIFFVVVTPIGIFMKIIGKDVLSLRFSKNTDTYWIDKKEQSSSMHNQF